MTSTQFKKLCSSTPKPQKPPPDPVKTWLLFGSSGRATVTLTQKCGIWFVTDSFGLLSLNDFTHLSGWGDTQIAVLRAAKNLHLSISSQRFVKRTEKPAITKKVSAKIS